MAASPRFVPEGVIPATLLALIANLEIDKEEARRPLRRCVDVDGVIAVTVNGHASKVHACTADEPCGDLVAARKINDRLFPLQQAFCAPPFVDMHNRMKETLVLLGQLKHAYVRPQLAKIPSEEIGRRRQALSAARINVDGAEPAN